MTGPYAEAARPYRELGWRGVLPVGWSRNGRGVTDWHPGRKDPPPAGYTGADGGWPDDATVTRWARLAALANVALRPPADVLGLDVDEWKVPGAWAALVERCGPLPPTWCSGARDLPSGIYWFRVPAGLRWRDLPAPGVEVVRFGHRYGVVPPSVHPEGMVYRWRIAPAEGAAGELPAGAIGPPPSGLAELPARAVAALVDPSPPAEARDPVAIALDYGPMAPGVRALLDVALADLTGAGRHDATRTHVLRLVRMAEAGKAGTGAALAELREGFVAAVADRATTAEAEAEFRRMLGGGVDLAARTECPRVEVEAEADRFWGRRPVLAHVRDFARARRASPWAVLGVTLARVIAATPPFVVLPPLVGSHLSLNTYVVLVGPSGGGKDAAIDAAGDALDVSAGVAFRTIGLGSGEGILDQYVRLRPRDPKANDPGGIEQHATSCLFTTPEVETVAALKGRSGATLLPELRKAWRGTELGFAYATEHRRLYLAAHAYRLCWVVGAQPERADVLLADQATGTPQRFVWLPVADPGAPDVAPTAPEPWPWRLPTWPAAERGRVELAVCAEAVEAIVTDRLARLRETGEAGALDAHALACREKLAAGLAILDGRWEVSPLDWELAGVVAEVSARTRGGAVGAVALARSLANVARGEAEAQRVAIVADATDERAMAAAGRQVVSRVVKHHATHDEGSCARRCLTQAVAGRVRELVSVDEVITRELAADRLVEVSGRYVPGPHA